MATLRRESYAEGTSDPTGRLLGTEDIEIAPEDQNTRQLHEKITAALDALEQADDAWPDLTAAQRTAAMRLAVRVSAKLARLALGRLEAS